MESENVWVGRVPVSYMVAPAKWSFFWASWGLARLRTVPFAAHPLTRSLELCYCWEEPARSQPSPHCTLGLGMVCAGSLL